MTYYTSGTASRCQDALVSAKEIAARLNISELSVYHHLRKLNGTFKPRAKKEDAPAVAAPVTTLRESEGGRLPDALSRPPRTDAR